MAVTSIRGTTVGSPSSVVICGDDNTTVPPLPIFCCLHFQCITVGNYTTWSSMLRVCQGILLLFSSKYTCLPCAWVQQTLVKAVAHQRLGTACGAPSRQFS